METTILPQLIRVEDFAQTFGLSVHQGYQAVRQLPPGVVVRLGRRIRLDAQKLNTWLAQGGSIN